MWVITLPRHSVVPLITFFPCTLNFWNTLRFETLSKGKSARWMLRNVRRDLISLVRSKSNLSHALHIYVLEWTLALCSICLTPLRLRVIRIRIFEQDVRSKHRMWIWWKRNKTKSVITRYDVRRRAYGCSKAWHRAVDFRKWFYETVGYKSTMNCFQPP